MGGHFHDIAAGTATPRSYEFAWNDDVIALNQFAGILSNATEAVTAALNTEAKGVPLVVFNPLNIAREDLVEAIELRRRHAEEWVCHRPRRQRSSGADFEWQSHLRGQGTIRRVCGLRFATRYGRRGQRCSASIRELAREPVLLLREAECGRRCCQHFRQIAWQRIAGRARTSRHLLRQPRTLARLEHGLGSGASCTEGLREWSSEKFAWWKTVQCA